MNIDKRFICQKCGGVSGTIPLNIDLMTQGQLNGRFKCKSCDYDILNDPDRLDCSGLVRIGSADSYQ
jgi:hypothetical protein